MDQRGLVERARGGDHDAFTELARGAVTRLDRAARLILRDPELARDAVQEALIRAWRDVRGLRDPDRFDAWLHRLTVNACLDMARHRRRRVIEVELLPAVGDERRWVRPPSIRPRGWSRLGRRTRHLAGRHVGCLQFGTRRPGHVASGRRPGGRDGTGDQDRARPARPDRRRALGLVARFDEDPDDARRRRHRVRLSARSPWRTGNDRPMEVRYGTQLAAYRALDTGQDSDVHPRVSARVYVTVPSSAAPIVRA